MILDPPIDGSCQCLLYIFHFHNQRSYRSLCRMLSFWWKSGRDVLLFFKSLYLWCRVIHLHEEVNIFTTECFQNLCMCDVFSRASSPSYFTKFSSLSVLKKQFIKVILYENGRKDSVFSFSSLSSFPLCILSVLTWFSGKCITIEAAVFECGVSLRGLYVGGLVLSEVGPLWGMLLEKIMGTVSYKSGYDSSITFWFPAWWYDFSLSHKFLLSARRSSWKPSWYW